MQLLAEPEQRLEKVIERVRRKKRSERETHAHTYAAVQLLHVGWQVANSAPRGHPVGPFRSSLQKNHVPLK
jgi:hypothetical protein